MEGRGNDVETVYLNVSSCFVYINSSFEGLTSPWVAGNAHFMSLGFSAEFSCPVMGFLNAVSQAFTP